MLEFISPATIGIILAAVLLQPSTIVAVAQLANNDGNNLCGAIVSGNTQLTEDLSCDGDGIKV
jgi:hypothetical protein